MTTQLTIAAAGPEPLGKLGQWFTPPKLAARMAAWVRPLFEDAARRAITLRVLEPSAGAGHLVHAVRALAPGASIDAVEIDPRFAAELRVRGVATRVHEGDYLARPAPARRYHLAIANPPFDGGDETEHLAKMLDEADRVVVLLPARSLHGRARWERVWSRLGADADGWYLRRKAMLRARPKFSASGGSDEIVVLDLRHGAAGRCEMEWW